MSKRKPHSDNLGYVCELRNRRTGIGHVVIYDRHKGFDCAADDRYVISCEEHHTMTSAPSMPKARAIMKAVDFCEECMAPPDPNALRPLDAYERGKLAHRKGLGSAPILDQGFMAALYEKFGNLIQVNSEERLRTLDEWARGWHYANLHADERVAQEKAER